MLVCELLEWQEDFRIDRSACGRRVPLKRSTSDVDLTQEQKKKKQATDFFLFNSCLFIDLVHGGV